jgi:hypothetical protein
VQCPEKIIPQKGKHQAGAILWCDWGHDVSGVQAVRESGFRFPSKAGLSQKNDNGEPLM